MTAEARKAYAREWYAKNKEKAKEYKRRSALRKALEDIESGKVSLVSKIEFQVNNERASGAF